MGAVDLFTDLHHPTDLRPSPTISSLLILQLGAALRLHLPRRARARGPDRARPGQVWSKGNLVEPGLV